MVTTLQHVIKDSTYENSDVKLFNVTTSTESNAENLLKDREVDAELIIPENFSSSMVALITSTAQSGTCNRSFS